LDKDYFAVMLRTDHGRDKDRSGGSGRGYNQLARQSSASLAKRRMLATEKDRSVSGNVREERKKDLKALGPTSRTIPAFQGGRP
jgi:hypothetical protein